MLPCGRARRAQARARRPGAGGGYARAVHLARLGVSLLKGSAQAHPDTLDLAGHGPVGDRRYCFVDLRHRDGPRVLRTVQNPRLVALRAHEADGDLVVVVPGRGPVTGAVATAAVEQVVHGDYWGRRAPLEVLDGPWAAAVSAYLGREVVLARARPRDVVYSGGVTLVTTPSLAELARRAGAAGTATARDEAVLVADAERFRATAVVAAPGAAPFLEDAWLGEELVLGEGEDAPVVRVTGHVPRCAVVRMRPGDGTREGWDPLRLLAPDRTRDGEVVMGVEGEVVRPGRLRAGAQVTIRPSRPATA
jgi:uncharacterized protein YcbX